MFLVGLHWRGTQLLEEEKHQRELVVGTMKTDEKMEKKLEEEESGLNEADAVWKLMCLMMMVKEGGQ